MNWHPKPLRPVESNPLFSLDEGPTFVLKSQTVEPVYLSAELLNKSEPELEKSYVSADDIVKAYMCSHSVDSDEEDTKKATTVGEKVGKVVSGAAKVATQGVVSAVSMGARAK